MVTATTIATAATKEAVQKEIQGLVSQVFATMNKTARDFYNKAKVNFETAFTDYLSQSFERYGMVKTLLYRHDPKWIYDIYEHTYLTKPEFPRSSESTSPKERIATQSILDVLQISRFLIIAGTGGSGKSMMMRHFFVDAILKQCGRIPVFVELRDLTRGTDLLDIIYANVQRLGITLEQKYFEYALQEGKFLILLDAYDEIPDNADGHACKEITDFCDTYNQNAFIVSARPEDFTPWQVFRVYDVDPLDKAQACRLISRLDYDEEVKTRFLEDLEGELFDRHESFASIPLLLNIMLLTYEQYAGIPEKEHLFYAQAFDTLFHRHDATKGSYRREHICKLSSDEFQNILAEFCFRSYAKRQTAFTEAQIKEFLTVPCQKREVNPDDFIKDMCLNICVLKLDGYDNYTFTHRTFQEYFSAVYLKGVPDDVQTKVAKHLVQRGDWKFDKLFDMLFDMDKTRFEKNIIFCMLDDHFRILDLLKKDDALSLLDCHDSEWFGNHGKTTLAFISDNDLHRVRVLCTRGNGLLSFSLMYVSECKRIIRVATDMLSREVSNYMLRHYPSIQECWIFYQEFKQDNIIRDYLNTEFWLSLWYQGLKSYYHALAERPQHQQDEMDALFE